MIPNQFSAQSIHPSTSVKLSRLLAKVGLVAAVTASLVAFMYPVDQGTTVKLRLICIAALLTLVFVFVIPCIREWNGRQIWIQLLNRFVGPTRLVTSIRTGWIALGDDRIETTEIPYGYRCLPFSEIDDVFWGGPLDYWQSLGFTTDFKIPRKVIASNTDSHWIFFYNQSDPASSILVVFNKKKERDQWLAISRGIFDTSVPCPTPPQSDSPSTRTLLGKTQIPYVIIRVFTLGVLLVFSLVEAHWRRVMSMGGLAVIAIYPFFIDLRRSSISMLSLALGFEYAKNHWDVKEIDLSQPHILGNRLYLPFLGKTLEVPSSIPLSDIRECRLEDCGNFLNNRELKYLFRRMAPPLYRTLRIIVDGVHPVEYKWDLPFTVAEDLCQQLIGERSPMVTETKSNSS